MADLLNKLSWDDFRIVKAVAEAAGIAGAAQALGLNHSTVFRRLGHVEESMGAKLFERHRAGYAPTPAGQEMIALAGRLEGDISGFTRRLTGGEIGHAGELRVTTNDSLLVSLLTPIFAGFIAQHRDIRLDVVLGNQAFNLSKRDADVAIRATDMPPDTLFGRKVARISWVLYGRKQDFPGSDIPQPDALSGRRWISLGDSFAHFKVVKRVREKVAPENIVYKLNTVLGLADAVEQGIGIAYLPCGTGDARPSLRRLSPIVPDFGTDLWLLTHPDLRHSPRVRLFMDFVAGQIVAQRHLLQGDAEE
jgi:DNA-binding transcriptional LysR family regulator